MTDTTPERGPLYGGELIDSLPLREGNMRQALPSAADLMRVRATGIVGADRVVGGYEVLVDHYRHALQKIESMNKLLEDYATMHLDLVEGESDG